MFALILLFENLVASLATKPESVAISSPELLIIPLSSLQFSWTLSLSKQPEY